MKKDFDIIDLDQTDHIPPVSDLYDQTEEYGDELTPEYTEEYSDEYTPEEADVRSEADGEAEEHYIEEPESYEAYDEENAGSEVFQGEVSVDTILMSDISDEVNERIEEQDIVPEFTGSLDFVELDEIIEDSYESAGDENYAEDEDYAEDEGYPEDEEYADDENDPEDEDYGYEDYEYEDEQYEVKRSAGKKSGGKKSKSRQPEGSFKDRIAEFFSNLTVEDWITAGMGVLIVCIAIITVVAWGNRHRAVETVNLYDVGENFSSIGIAGESGLIAMANAHTAPPMEEEPEETAEVISVKITLTSVERDLKIKFINTTTDRLITNVPFELILKRNNNEYSFKDEDLDGIIYDKTVSPGEYQVEIVPMEGYEFTNYPSTVTVKDQIVYEQIDVTQEIKTETEINAAVEDTAVNNAEIEAEREAEQIPVVTDTVEWVESTRTTVDGSDGYREIDKDTIPEPAYSARNAVYVASEQRAAAVPMQRYIITDRLFRTTARDVSGNSASENSVSGNGTGTTDGDKTDTEETPRVTEKNASVTISGAETIKVGDTLTLSASAKDGSASLSGGTYTWKSSNSSVAEVNNGKVTAKAEGTATISVEYTMTEGNVTYKGSASVSITVEKKEAEVNVAEVKVNPATLSLSVSESKVIAATAVMSDNSEVKTASSFTFETSDVNIATVDASGKVTGVAAGTATIKVTYKDAQNNTKSATCTVTVTQQTMESIALDKTSLTIRNGSSETLTATVTMSDGTKITDAGKMTWKSTDTSVATVDAAGKVTAVGTGTAKITVSYKDAAGTTKSVDCTVTVTANPQDDTTTKLVDKNGNQVYIKNSSGNYVEATYADYYTASKFYIKTDVEYIYTGWQTINGNVYYYDKNHNKVTGEQIIQGIKYNFTQEGILAMNNNGTLGIDVSKWNGTIDWSAVKNSGISFVIIRCGYRGSSTGVLVEDPMFKRNIQGAAAAGLKVGVYFFTQAVNEVEAVEEASMVISLIKGYGIAYPVFIDTEKANGRADGLDRGTRTAVCRAFCETIRSAGYTAGVYASKSWYNDNLDYNALSSYRIWLAQYAPEPTFGRNYHMWQYSEKGTVSGINGRVDMNISYLGY